MLKKTLLLILISSVTAWPQAQSVNQVAGPPPDNWVSLMFYSSTNLVNVCHARAYQPPTSYYVASSTLTSIVVSANVGTINFPATAQLWQGETVTVSGSTTSALNATYSLTAVSGSTATITTSGVGNATYNNAALTLTTNGPALNAPVWSIEVLLYSGSSVTQTYWGGAPNPGGGPSQGLACSNRANY